MSDPLRKVPRECHASDHSSAAPCACSNHQRSLRVCEYSLLLMQGVVSTPGVPQYCDNTCRLLRLGTSLRGDHAGCLDHAVSSCPHSSHWGGACLSSTVPSWDCSEELKGCSKGPGFLSLFLAICRERRITTLTFLTFSEYCLTVLFHVRILILLSAEAFLDLFYFNAGNPKQ